MITNLKKILINARSQNHRLMPLAISFGISFGIMGVLFLFGTMDHTAHALIAQGPGCGGHRLCCPGNYNSC